MSLSINMCNSIGMEFDKLAQNFVSEASYLLA